MASASYTSVDSLLGRLELIDERLRQLEEKQREPESYFAADLRARGKPLPSAVDVVSLKGNLMSRLQLLENRIRQLSHELEKGGSDGGGGWATSSTVVAAHAKEESGSTSSQSQMQKLVVSGNEDGRVAEGTWRTGADGHRFKKKVRSVSMPKRVLRCIFCTDDDNCCLKSPSSSSCECEDQGCHAGCYN